MSEGTDAPGQDSGKPPAQSLDAGKTQPDASVARDSGPTQPPLAAATSCDTCLLAGGTWQPEGCTADCDIQDTACFRDVCPAPCGPENCDGCFDGEGCAQAGCFWNEQGEARWCTSQLVQPPPATGPKDASPIGDAGSPEANDASVPGNSPGTDAATSQDSAVPPSECSLCLGSGGTWQPEAESCTVDCDIQDISCFRDACPPECSLQNCSSCFSKLDCDQVDCSWTALDEFPTCMTPPEL